MNSSATMSEQRIKLSDGRALGYAEFGTPTGNPILLFNGSASRLFYPLDDAVAIAAKARIITVDRPGIGLSTFKPHRTLLDWPADVQALADALGCQHFAVAGASAGGPYAAACAFTLPERVTALGLISSLAPFNIPSIVAGMTPAYRMIPVIANYAPWLLTFAQALIARYPEAAWKQFYARLPDCDKTILRMHPDVDMRAALVGDVPEIYRAGPKGGVWDTILLTRPWGFSPAAIAVQTLLWHGEQDMNVPLSMGQFLAKAIPGCTARFIPNEGHLMYINQWPEIVRTLSGKNDVKSTLF